MLRIRRFLGLFLLAGVGLVGCTATESQIRPPKPIEEFKAPPDEPRYSKPIEYPRETMEQDMLLKKAKDNSKAQPSGPGGMRGGMPQAGRPGGM